MLTRRKFVQGGIVGVSALALAGCMTGISSRGNVELTHRAISIPNLPEKFKGRTITLLSDIHSSPFMSGDEMAEIVKMVNSLKSDMIIMPGDYVTSHHNEIPPFVEAMSELKAPLGIYGSTGNHDYYSGVDEVTAAVEDIGIKMLRNESAYISLEGEKLYLVGVDDADSATVKSLVEGGHAPHIEAAFKGIPETAATILLCHKPYDFDYYSKMNVGLMLSGHTHGGQIVLGRLGGTTLALSSIASHYIEGLYHAPDATSKSQLYVSRGIGTVGLPLRINCPPEITQITLA